MIEDFEIFLAKNIKTSKRSIIRELLKLVEKPDIISFAGGLPSPEAFPIDDITNICNEIIPKQGARMMQYGPTEGDEELRAELVKRAQLEGLDVTDKNLLITTASQQGLDLSAKIFIDRGDSIIVGIPTYLGGLSAFRNYGADIHGVNLDENGISAIELKNKIEDLKEKGKIIKFIYIIPDFQNPSGITMSEKRRHEIIEIASKYNIVIIEDSPYRELRYKNKPIPTLYSLDKEGRVIYLGTFSKTFIPGFRIGWIFANENIVDKFIIAKQGTDLCTSPFNQRIAAEYLKRGMLENQIKKVKSLYTHKMEVMLDALKKYMPKGVKWTNPDGGLFLLVTVPKHIDLEAQFNRAIEHNVAYVIGNAFAYDNSKKNTMRINFSFPTVEKIKEGIKRLARVVESLT